MTPAEIEKHITDAVARGLEQHLPIAVKTAVDVAVNGKIKSLREDMEPIIEAFNTWRGWRRGMAAIFLPLSAVVGFGAAISLILTFFKK